MLNNIRAASLVDVPRMVEMGQRFRNETVYAAQRHPWTEMATLAARLIVSDAAIVLVAERDGRVVGMFGALLFAHHLTGLQTAGELFFWVEPEHRGCGVRLLRRAERVATARGAVSMQMIAPTPDVETLYGRLGYTPLEVAYEKGLTSCL